MNQLYLLSNHINENKYFKSSGSDFYFFFYFQQHNNNNNNNDILLVLEIDGKIKFIY